MIFEKKQGNQRDYPAFLIDKNLIHKNELFKVLGRGEITVALEVHANKFSETAKAAIEKAGGSTHAIGR